jgi:hypothetical protein
MPADQTLAGGISAVITAAAAPAAVVLLGVALLQSAQTPPTMTAQ